MDEIENFKHPYYLSRIALAVAIAVIKHTPPNSTASEHAKNLQEIIKKKELIKKEESKNMELKRKIQEFQEEILWTSMTYSPKVEETSQYVEFQQIQDNHCTNIEFYTQFMLSVIELKYLINSSTSSISSSQIAGCLNSQCGFLSQQSADINDSRDGVSPYSIEYIMRSTETDKLLGEAMNTVLNQLSKMLTLNNPKSLSDCIRNWKGSMFEDAVNIIVCTLNCTKKDNIEFENCYSVCENFIKETVDEIFEDSHKVQHHHTFEYLCYPICQLCTNIRLCFKSINNLLGKIESLSELDTHCELKEKLMTEARYFYVIHLLEKLLKIFEERYKLEVRKTIPTESTICEENVYTMWRQSWKGNEKRMDHKLKSIPWKKSIFYWKSTLESSIMSTSIDKPLLAISLSSCLDEVQQIINCDN